MQEGRPPLVTTARPQKQIISSIEPMTSHLDAILGTEFPTLPGADYPDDPVGRQLFLAFVDPDRLPHRVRADFGSELQRLKVYLGYQRTHDLFEQENPELFPFTLSHAQMQYFLGVRRVAHGLMTGNNADIVGGYRWQWGALRKLGDHTRAQQLWRHISAMETNMATDEEDAAMNYQFTRDDLEELTSVIDDFRHEMLAQQRR